MPDRMEVLRERAKPSRGSTEHQKLKADLGGVEPAPDHPLYPEFVRLTDPKPMGRPRGSDVLPSGIGPTEMGQARYNEHLRVQKARLERAKQRIQEIRDHYESTGAPIDDDAVSELYLQERDQGIPAIRRRLPVEMTRDSWPTEAVRGVGERLAWWDEHVSATKRKPAKKKAKPRKPEEVWYDVHKHPEGTPGGMGKSPEHHLRNRGWNGHQINEGSGKRTMQYRNHKHPDFVISYGGGSPTKPDHNFRVLYMGTNKNVPKVTRAFSVAEAMNKVEELQQLEGGLIVQPVTHESAATTTPSLKVPPREQDSTVYGKPWQPEQRKDMSRADEYPIGIKEPAYPTKPPSEEKDWTQVQEIKPVKPEKDKPAGVKVHSRMARHGSWEE